MKIARWTSWGVVLLLAVAVAGCTGGGVFDELSGVVGAKSETVLARKKLMKKQGGLMKQIVTASKGEGYAAFSLLRSGAMDMAAAAKKIPGAFAKEDLTPPTTALAKIWTEKSTFDQGAANLAFSAQILLTAVENNDKAGIANAVKTVGANCGKCHKAYRVPPKKKMMKK
ncbi:MAG: cytochrome c [bacterium]|nr:cytochrome c [bacterium]